MTINSFYNLRPESSRAGEFTASEAEDDAAPPSTADTDDTTELTMHSNASTESTATVDKPYYKLTSAARLRRSIHTAECTADVQYSKMMAAAVTSAATRIA